MEVKGLNTNYKDIHAQINYELTPIQKKASKQILNYVKNEKSVIVNAVCGAGKTELVYESIEYYLNKNLKVAFAIPRKEVVKEIYKRLGRTVTTIRGKGLISGDKEVMYCVLTRMEIYELRHIAEEMDESAFITILEVSDIIGQHIKSTQRLSHKKVRYQGKEDKA